MQSSREPNAELVALARALTEYPQIAVIKCAQHRKLSRLFAVEMSDILSRINDISSFADRTFRNIEEMGKVCRRESGNRWMLAGLRVHVEQINSITHRDGNFLNLWNKIADERADQVIRLLLGAAENLEVFGDDRHHRDVGPLLILSFQNAIPNVDPGSFEMRWRNVRMTHEPVIIDAVNRHWSARVGPRVSYVMQPGRFKRAF